MNKLLEFSIFTLISSVEYIAVFLFMFSLFRIPYQIYKYHTAFACVLLSYISFTMRTAGQHFEAAAPFIQIVTIIILVWLLYQVQWFYAIFIAVSATLTYGLLQTIVLFTFIYYGFIDKQNIVIYEINGLSVVLLSSTCLFLITLAIRRRKWGFTFIPLDQRSNFKLRHKSNMKLIIVLIILAAVLFSTIYVWYGVDDFHITSLIIVVIFPIFLAWLLFQAFKKERTT